MTTVTTLLCSTLLALGSASLAAQAATPDVQTLVKERQQGFQNMGKSMKAMGKNLKKKEQADFAVIAQAARTLAQESQKIPGWFPKGSGPETKLEMEALASIWEPQSDFKAIADKLAKDSAQLVNLISSKDHKAIITQLRKVKGSCGSCHDSYKAD